MSEDAEVVMLWALAAGCMGVGIAYLIAYAVSVL